MKRAIAALALVLVPATAAANGRFPYANQLVVAPTDPTRLTMRTTYGVLQSFDAGARWLWLCETSIGYGGTLDPAIAVTAEGRLLAGLFGAGVATSSDRGCTFTSDAAPFTGLYVIDLAVDPSNPSRVVAITSSGSAGGTFTVVVGESVDGGATWKQLGAALPPTFNAETIEVAASRKERLYASGSRTGVPSDAGADGEVGPAGRVGLLYRSDDHGASWKELPVDLEGGLAAFVSAVDPKDPDRIYVRVSADPKSGSTTDHLLFSPDGGASFTRDRCQQGQHARPRAEPRRQQDRVRRAQRRSGGRRHEGPRVHREERGRRAVPHVGRGRPLRVQRRLSGRVHAGAQQGRRRVVRAALQARPALAARVPERHADPHAVSARVARHARQARHPDAGRGAGSTPVP